MINQNRLLETFLELVNINGESGNEILVSNFLQKKLADIGLTVAVDEASKSFNGTTGNVIGFWGGTDDSMPSILLSAHMDTILPTKNIKTVIKDNRIKTDGNTILGADNRVGVSVILELLRVLKEQNLPHPPIYVVFSVAEEIGMYGSKYISTNQEIDAKIGFVFDSSAMPGNVIINAPSSRKLEIKLIGKSAHAAVNPSAGVSAIKIAGNAISKIDIGKFEDNSTFNIGKINGGKAINIVPDIVELEAEYRGFDYDLMNQKIEEVRSIFKIEADKLGGTIKFNEIEKYELFNLDLTSAPVEIAFEAIRKLGLEPKGIRYSGGSDANIYNSIGISTVNLGMGFQNVHSTNENIMLNNLYKDAEIGINIVLAAHNYFITKDQVNEVEI